MFCKDFSVKLTIDLDIMNIDIVNHRKKQHVTDSIDFIIKIKYVIHDTVSLWSFLAKREKGKTWSSEWKDGVTQQASGKNKNLKAGQKGVGNTMSMTMNNYANI